MSNEKKLIAELDDMEFVLLFCHPAPPHARVSRGVSVEAQRRILAVIGCDELGGHGAGMG